MVSLTIGLYLLEILDNGEGGDCGQTIGSNGKSEETVPSDKNHETQVEETSLEGDNGTLVNNLSTVESWRQPRSSAENHSQLKRLTW